MDRLAHAQLTQKQWQQRRSRKTAGTVGVQQTWRPSTRIGFGDRILRQYTPRVSSFGPVRSWCDCQIVDQVLAGGSITRHLSSAPSFPAQGLSYFNPYGARTGEMWRSFKRWLEIQAEHHAVND